MMNRWMLTSGVVAAWTLLGAWGDTVAVAPGNGVATNVTTWLTGDVSVAVNPEMTGGGVVALNPNNTYTGGTTLGCGTLLARGLSPAGCPSSVGSEGIFTLGAGTIRYVGPSGAVWGQTLQSGHAAATNLASVIDTQSDLTLTGPVNFTAGALVKTGPATLTIAGGTANMLGRKGLTSANAAVQLNLNANGDAPTAGYGDLTVAEGTLRIAGGTNTIGANLSSTFVGVRSSEDGSDEKSATLEIAGGVNQLKSQIEVGRTYRGGSEKKGVFRVTGGKTTTGNVYIGPNTTMGCEYWADFEMTGGSLLVSNTTSVFLGRNANVGHVRMDVSGGTLTITRNLGYAFQAGKVEKHLETVIRDTATVSIGNRIYFDSDHANSVQKLTIRDGGLLKVPYLSQEGTSSVDVLIDGGVVYWTSADAVRSFRAADTVAIGTKGATLKTSTTTSYKKTLTAADTSAGEPAGVTFASGSHVLEVAMGWKGPTIVKANAELQIKAGGSLPSGTDLVVEPSGIVKIGAAEQVVGDLVLNGQINMYPGTPVTVTGSLSGSGTIAFYAAQGSGTYMSEPGLYPILRASSAQADTLAAAAAKLSFLVGGQVEPEVSVSGDVATLSLKITPAVVYDAPAADASGALLVADGDALNLDNIYVDASSAADPQKGRYTGLTVNGGTLACDKIYCSATGAVPTTVTLNGGLVEVRQAHFNPGYVKSGAGATLYFNEGATLRAYGIQGVDATYGGTVYFNGGVLQPVAAEEGNGTYVQYAKKIYVSAGGCKVDMQYFDRDFTGSYINFKTPFLHDPALGDTKDGGITVVGHGLVDFGSGIRGSTFTGPVTARDGGFLSVYGGPYMNGHDYVIGPGGGLAPYTTTPVYMDSLLLGEANATTPAVLMAHTDASKYSYVVSNDVSVLSPVEVGIGTWYSWRSPSLSVGVYTALVYRATCSLDTSLFRATPASRNRALATSEVVLSTGAYAGWKALVFTVTAQTPAVDATWTATAAGGAWMDAANWTSEVAPSDAGLTVVFPAATGSAVPVTGSAAESITKISLQGDGATKGYAFTDPQEFVTEGSYAAAMAVEGGAHTMAGLNVPSALAMSVASGSSLTVDALTGTARTTVSGAGRVQLGTSAFKGYLTQGGTGRVVVDDLAFATAASRMVVSGQGSVSYTGGDVDSAAMRIEAKPAVVEIVGDTRVQTSVFTNGTSSAAVVKAGSGTLVLGGTKPSSFAGASSATSYTGAKTIGTNGAAPTAGFWGFNVAEGTVEIGVKDDASQAPNVTVKGGAIGLRASPAGGTARLVMNNGTFTSTDVFCLGYYGTYDSVLTADLVVNGGQMNLTQIICGYMNGGSNKHRIAATIEVNGGELKTSSSILLSRDQRYNDTAGAKALRHVFRQNGGQTTVGTSFVAGNSVRGLAAHGWVEVNGGVLAIGNQYQFGGYKGDKSDLFLNGGELRLKGDFVENKNMADETASGKVVAALHFNGGLLRPTDTNMGVTRANNPDTLFLVEEGGAVIDTSLLTGEYTIETDLVATNAVDGGLVKKGVGTLVLAGSNTYAGATIVASGVLKASGDHAFDGTKYLRVQPGARFDLAGTTVPVPRVYTDGLYQNGTLNVTESFVVGETLATVDGDLAVSGDVAVDLADVDAPSVGDAYPLVVVTGSISAPARAKVLNAGSRVKGCKLTVQDGVLWATASSGGTVLVFR